jgi:uncharacterized membrane protein YeaQ/YmgE (transglycosylase-associated protein family)
MAILATLVIGLIVGLLARLFMPGRYPGGIIFTTILGVAGSFVAGLFGHFAGWYHPFQGPGIFASVLGAMVLLLLARLFSRQHP